MTDRRDPAPGALVLHNDRGWTVEVLPLGARLHAVRLPTADGVADLLVGPSAPERHRADRLYLGATIGRVANRIRDARFRLGGEEVRLTANDGRHTLHGGGAGAFDAVVWSVLDHDAGLVRLGHESPAGSEGFPGLVSATVAYELTADTLAVTMTATTDAVTPLSMTNHAYWNLRGDGGTVLDHELSVMADQLVVTDGTAVPTGELLDVGGTPYDLRATTVLRSAVDRLARRSATGLDDPYLLRDGDAGLREVARLHEPTSGRTLVLSSDQVCLQVFTCGATRLPWRDSTTTSTSAAVALEPQAVPDAVNLRRFPSPLLHPGETYVHRLQVRIDDPATR